MNKADAEKAVRHLVHDWRRNEAADVTDPRQLSVYEFITWLGQHHPQVLTFRSTMGARDDIERWFDQELKLTWMN